MDDQFGDDCLLIFTHPVVSTGAFKYIQLTTEIFTLHFALFINVLEAEYLSRENIWSWCKDMKVSNND